MGMNQENMLDNPSSSFNKKRGTNISEINNNVIEKSESRKGKHQLKNDDEEAERVTKISKKYIQEDDNLELQVQYSDFSIAPQNQEGVDLAVGSATSNGPVIQPRQSQNQHDSSMNSLIQGLSLDLSIECLSFCPRYNYASIALLNRRFREVIRSGEIYKLRSKKGVIEHWVYFSCQHLMWEAFDPISINWMHLPKLTAATKSFEFSDKESLAVGTELLVLGNDLEGDGIHKYSLLTNSWSTGKQMNTPRCLFGSASLDQFAIFAGGVDRKGKIVDTVERYDSRTEGWERLPSLLKPRKLSSGVFMDGKFYVIGGSGGRDTRPLTCGEAYDFDEMKWTEIPNMSPGGGWGSMAPPLLAVIDNELYAADCTTMTIKKYNKKKIEWKTIGRLPQRPNHVDGWGIAFRGCGKRIIIVGGPRAHNEAYVEIYSWDPAEGPPEWKMLGRKKSDNFVYNCSIMGC